MSEPRKLTLAVDFDGVIHSYTSPWQAASVIPDPPVPGAIDFLSRMLAIYNVAIFSSRNHQAGGITAMREWLNRHGMAFYLVDMLEFPQEKPPAILTIDDRAFCFRGVFPTVEEIKAFKPWNK